MRKFLMLPVFILAVLSGLVLILTLSVNGIGRGRPGYLKTATGFATGMTAVVKGMTTELIRGLNVYKRNQSK